ncbi:transcriptional regulator, XRE family with cupin sensor [Rhodoblastus acidophilus]|uniref:Transcriptional regulator, XRE family with cupin sensor n=1 Tax=Rhodoblastus acidophilus TaxID=1074 RepID=A0A212PZ48_RHOAC|nr:XRE family transcriptional regulator [Rhodoblastus acidophilus]PPQ38679.1 XRE family transcriptional regulator [Rhodoblastus acidophilus]RAI17824.1 XRE family transcriptional regulator [Rhodoblastus acidophilus]SNB52375.1 transcriptional regulator, XRE family with cupin sensor [Rhodoblastus acidophilus]
MNAKHVEGPPVTEHDLTQVIAARLNARLKHEKNALGHLANFAGVDPELLSAIVGGRRAPSIDVLWQIANALDVPFGSLIATPRRGGASVIRKSDANVLSSSDGAFKSRALMAFGDKPRVEIYELTVAAGHIESSQAHAPGTSENILVVRGTLEIVAGREPAYLLNAGDAIHFDADVPHSYRALGDDDALAHLLMSYDDIRD